MSFPWSPDPSLGAPPASLAIHLDLVGGIAGDMFVAAMIDAMPALETAVRGELAAVQPAWSAESATCEAASGGLRASRFAVPDRGARRLEPHDRAIEAGAHGGTRYVDLVDQLESAAISEGTRKHALALLALLGDAEARVHGISLANVHFHELADWDSMLDLVAAGTIASLLEGAVWTASPLPMGSGTTRTAHGLLPVPPPAVTALLVGYPWHDDGVPGERITPTGAAVLRHLVPAVACTGKRDAGRLLAVGSGAGTRVLPGIPNILRVMVFERASTLAGDTIAVIEFDLDDMTGEEIAIAADRLRERPGVLDVSTGTRQGKKGRPLTSFRVLAEPRAAEDVAATCFLETSTLGLRLREERRRVLRRQEVAVAVEDGSVNVKLAERPLGKHSAKAAHDDIAAVDGLGERRRRRAEFERKALESDPK